MQFELTSEVTLSVTCANDGADAEIQMLTTDPDGIIVRRSPIAMIPSEKLTALANALSAYAEALSASDEFHLIRLAEKILADD